VPEVRVIDDEGNQVGMMKTPDAVKFAQERDLDLVEVAPEAKPPVCRVLDYSKYKYEQAQKVKQARKHQQQITIREIKFRPKIAEHDYDTKKHHVERFLRHKDKVKITIMFRGREVTHPERGVMILDRLAEELAALGVVEQRPTQDGRNMTMMLGPSKAVLAGKADGDDAAPAPVAGDDGAHAPVTGDDAASARLASDDAAPAPAASDDAAPAPAPAASDDAAHAPAASDEASEAPSNGAVSSSETLVPPAEESDEALVEVPSDAAEAEAEGGAPDSVAPAAESPNGASDGAVS